MKEGIAFHVVVRTLLADQTATLFGGTEADGILDDIKTHHTFDISLASRVFLVERFKHAKHYAEGLLRLNAVLFHTFESGDSQFWDQLKR
jgi:hypothetical protein